MVVYKFDQQDPCSREHSGLKVLEQTEQQHVSSCDTDISEMIEFVKNEMYLAEQKRIWPLSYCAPFPGKPELPGFENHSFEEIRNMYYESKGSMQKQLEYETMLQHAHTTRKALQNPTPEIINMLVTIYKKPTKSSTINISSNNNSVLKEPTNQDIYKKLQEIEIQLEKQLKVTSKTMQEVEEIKTKLKIDQNKAEQILLKNNAIIYELPVQKENLRKVVQNLFNHLNIHDVDEIKYDCFRLGKSNVGTAPPIKIVFNNQKSKLMLFKAKKNKILRAPDLGIASTSDKNIIHIEHDLTKFNQELFKKAKQFKKANNYAFAWIKNGVIMLRKTEESEIITISCLEDLEKLKN